MPGIFWASYGAMWLLLLVMAVLLVLVYRHFGLVALGTVDGISRDGLHIGEQAPRFRGMTDEGQDVEWTPVQGHYQVLAFVSPECQPCAKILPSLGQLAHLRPELSVSLIVNEGGADLERLEQKFLSPPEVQRYADQGGSVYTAYRVRITPFAYLIGKDGQILAKGLCDDVEKLNQLVAVIGIDIPQVLVPQVLEVTRRRAEMDSIPQMEQRLVNK